MKSKSATATASRDRRASKGMAQAQAQTNSAPTPKGKGKRPASDIEDEDDDEDEDNGDEEEEDEDEDEDDDEDDDDDEEDGDEDDEDEDDEDDDGDDMNESSAYGLAILQQLGIDPASVPSAQSQPLKTTTSKQRPNKQNTAATQAISNLDSSSSSTHKLRPQSSLKVAHQIPPARRQPEEVVFDGFGTSGSSSAASKEEVQNTYVDSKAARKAFMSSRIDRIGDGPALSGTNKNKATTDQDEEGTEEKEHKANDRLLSHLLSTTLFAPGSDASSTPPTKRNGKPALDPTKGTLASILELSSSTEQRKGAVVGRGWGDAQARLQDLGKMPARLREGLKKAAKGRVEKEQDRAKELGLVHRSLNKGKKTNMGGTGAIGAVDMALSGVGSSKKAKDRVRGLGLGVGTFGGGKLTISTRDVEKINGPSSSRGPPGGGGRGGRGGRGGGRGGGGGGGGGRGGGRGGGGGGGPANKKQRRQ
ncbi:hypothetical protein A4X13_0g3124 [Tilletia indica]|uniref:Protein FAF1 n=1 Tax=Tilletia indica TaxID=43049 RepID=A0A177TX01_9BASI|nr:hypothetical protein A4X13_0g3124 [Tilletia indica]